MNEEHVLHALKDLNIELLELSVRINEIEEKIKTIEILKNNKLCKKCWSKIVNDNN
jgi:hypothetical protein